MLKLLALRVLRLNVKATNQVLTCLDRMRSHPNVIVFCTSNLESTIDPAFLDRVDFKQLVLAPGPAARYEILRSSLNEMHRCGLIHRNRSPIGWLPVQLADPGVSEQLVPAEPVYAIDSEGSEPLKDAAHALDGFIDEPEADESRLWFLAKKAEVLKATSAR